MTTKYLYVLLWMLLGTLRIHGQTPILVADLVPGNVSSNAVPKAVFNGKLYLLATTPASGLELWHYDGLNAPSIVYDLNPGAATGVYYSGDLVVFNSKLYFCGGTTSTGYELYSYDGTNPPALVTDLIAGGGSSYLTPITVFNNKLVCVGSTASAGLELYLYDGVNAPVLYDIFAGTGSSNPLSFAPYKGKLYFNAGNATNGRELFVYDPATNQATLALDLEPGTNGSLPSYLQEVNGILYFAARTANTGFELYSYDGTLATRLTDVYPNSGDGVTRLKGFQNKIYLVGNSGSGSRQLYSYDPATAITAPFYAPNPSGDANPFFVSVYHDKLYFTATMPGTGYELWATDGTNTVMLPEVDAGSRSSYAAAVAGVEYQGSLYFSASDSLITGTELYRLTTPMGVRSIGTTATTTVYPNPTTGSAQLVVDLTAARTVQVVLTDAAGRQVQKSEWLYCSSGKTALPLFFNALPTGWYHYSLYDDTKVLLQSGPVVKQ